MVKTMTHQEFARCFDLLEQRLRLVRRVASALEQGQTALVTMDAKQIEQQVNDQQALCQEWRLVEHEIQLQYRTISATRCGTADCPLPLAGLCGSAGPRWKTLTEELAQVEMRVRHLTRVHTALLRRMRRSISVVANILASSAVSYTVPAAPTQPVRQWN